ncbi:unnamed protein product [Auanema sp. JU1783]|nr:unnamed protein product [Auanema sp. JU1783]
MNNLVRVQILLLIFIRDAVFSFIDERHESYAAIYTNELSLHKFRLARSSDKNSKTIRGILTFPNGTLLHANRVSPEKVFNDEYPIAVLRDLLQLPQLSELRLGPIRIGRGQHEPDDQLLKAVIILPDGRRFRGFRTFQSNDGQHSRYINKGNLGAFIYDSNAPTENTEPITKLETNKEHHHRDSFYLRKGEIGAYIYGSLQQSEEVRAQCRIKKNLQKGDKRRYLVLHQEPCEPNQQHKLWKLKDGREIVYYGDPEYVHM